jgi:uncharacterized repeat protein (TIGR03806 family)
MKKYFLFLLLGFGACNMFNRSPKKVILDATAEPFQKLSDYGFFTGEISELKTNKDVVTYSLINTMFNDYARKQSFVYVPGGKKLETDSTGNFLFPENSCLINCVYYLNDERDSTKGKRLVETQLLVKDKSGWMARNYVWNDEQSDAELNIIGDVKTLKWLDKNGGERNVDFVIAGKNQCKSCHNSNGNLIPIGFNASELTKESEALVSTSSGSFKHVNWRDTSLTKEERVRAYLNINCAHCHSEKGPAKVSGLFLNYDNHNMETYGICKSPPSAGKGSCNLKYDIVPGKPGESIIICRMAATDLETKMPELGRTVPDNEGVSLIVEWIADMKQQACTVNE